MLECDLGLGAVERSVEEVEATLLTKFQPDLGCRWRRRVTGTVIGGGAWANSDFDFFDFLRICSDICLRPFRSVPVQSMTISDEFDLVGERDAPVDLKMRDTIYEDPTVGFLFRLYY